MTIRCTQDRDPEGFTNRKRPVPFPSWYLPGTLTEETKAAVSEDFVPTDREVNLEIPHLFPHKMMEHAELSKRYREPF